MDAARGGSKAGWAEGLARATTDRLEEQQPAGAEGAAEISSVIQVWTGPYQAEAH